MALLAKTAPLPLPAKSPAKSATAAPLPPDPGESEIYWSADRKCGVAITRSDFSKDEDKDDTDAIKLEDVVYELVDNATNKVNMIHFSTKEGWPVVDMDVLPAKGEKITLGGVEYPVSPEMGTVRYRVYRTKSKNFLIQIYGPLSKEDRLKVLDSFTLPKEVGRGKLTKWGPEAKKQYLNASRVEVWSPIEFKEDEGSDSDSSPDSKDFTAEFGYTQLEIVTIGLPKGSSEQMPEAALDSILKSYAEQESEGDDDKTVLDEIKGYTLNLVNYRFATGKSGSQDVRFDVAVENDMLFIFSIYAPHGMLESDDIKHFVSSFSIR